MRRVIRIALVLIFILTVISACSKEEKKKLAPSSPLELKSEYVSLINDDIIVEMIEKQYSLMIDAYNDRNKDTGEIKLDKSVSLTSEFITADIEKAQNINNQEKANLLLDLESPYLMIIKSLKFDSPVISKNSDGYKIDSSVTLSREDLDKIKNELDSNLDQYFK